MQLTQKGFTFVEIILVMAVIMISGVMTASVSGNFYFRKNIDAVEETLGLLIRKAQIYTLEGKNGSSWGVALSGDTLILFEGNDFATRDSTFDETYTLPGNVTLSGFETVVCERGTARISGDIGSFSLTGFGQFKELFLNQEGAIRLE